MFSGFSDEYSTDIREQQATADEGTAIGANNRNAAIAAQDSIAIHAAGQTQVANQGGVNFRAGNIRDAQINITSTDFGAIEAAENISLSAMQTLNVANNNLAEVSARSLAFAGKGLDSVNSNYASLVDAISQTNSQLNALSTLGLDKSHDTALKATPLSSGDLLVATSGNNKNLLIALAIIAALGATAYFVSK